MGIRGKKVHSIIIIDDPLGPMEGCVSKTKIPGLFKEEDAVFKSVKRLFEDGPSRVMTNIQGDATRYKRYKRFAQNRDRHNILQVLEEFHVYIRDDGWMLAAHREHTDVAYNMWKTNWIGRVDIGCILGKYSAVSIFPESGMGYRAGIVDKEGLIVSMVDAVKKRHEATQNNEEPPAGPKSLDDIRDWMRRGCPD